jgi:hypothetical protein
MYAMSATGNSGAACPLFGPELRFGWRRQGQSLSVDRTRAVALRGCGGKRGVRGDQDVDFLGRIADLPQHLTSVLAMIWAGTPDPR